MNASSQSEKVDAIVVGAGLAGLTATALLAKSGVRVVALEATGAIGGSARTDVRGDFSLNLGPHALYRSGAGRAIYRELDIEVRGKLPPARGLALFDGALTKLPLGPWSTLTSGLLSFGGKIELGRLMSRLLSIDPEEHHETTVGQWLDENVRDRQLQQLIEALARLTSYANAPARQSAGAFFRQLKLANEAGVLYLDGGWQTLVDQLANRARKDGASIRTRAKVVALTRQERHWRAQLDNGQSYRADNVLITTSVGPAKRLIETAGTVVPDAWQHQKPVRAACLDLGLDSLPRPANRFVLGIDQPVYLSVHSASADLAPPGGAMIHVAKYLPPDTSSAPADDEAELESLLDLAQPGWREQVCERRYLPHITVANALDCADSGGIPGRPSHDSTRLRGVFVAGDWVGPEGVLSDASLASAKAAALAVMERRTISAAA